MSIASLQCLRGMALAILLTATSTTLVSGQSSTTRGWSFGFRLSGNALSVEQADAQNGAGAGLQIGYGFNRMFTLFFSADGAEIDVPSGSNETGTWSMGQAELGARFHFANALRRWVPYLETSLGARSVSAKLVDRANSPTTTFSGSALSVGGGLAIHLKQTLALDLNTRFTGGTFSNASFGTISVSGQDIDASSVRASLGLTWWP